MRIICTDNYDKIVVSQKFFNPDEEDGIGNLSDYPEMRPLPTVGPEEAFGVLEDRYDDDVIGDQSRDEQNTGQDAGQDYEEYIGEEVTDRDYPKFPNPFAATDWATQNKEVLRIRYRTKGGRSITRDVEPHGKFHAKTTHHDILVTFDQTVGNIRAFRIVNIFDYSFLDQQYEPKFIVSQR